MAAITEETAVGPHDLVTEEHVQTTLKADKGNEAKLISWKIEDFTKKGDNMATFVTSVSVTYSEKGETYKVSYVVKLNPCLNVGVTYANMIFCKEARYYQELAPVLNSLLESAGQTLLRIPKCLYFCLEADREAIFLEDLRPKGFKMTEAGLSGMDYPHVIILLKELARLHATSYVLQKKRPGEDLLEKFDFLKAGFTNKTEAETEFHNKMMLRGNAIAIAMLEHLGGYEKVVDWIKKHRTSSSDIMDIMLTSSPPFDVVCHGDMHVNNALFRYNDEGEPVEVMILDHQVNRICSLATDLNYLLYISVLGVVRQPNLETFLRTYFDSFNHVVESCGERLGFSFEEFFQEFRNKHPFGLLFSLLVAPLLVVQVGEFPDAQEFFSNLSEEMTDGESEKIFKALDNNHAMRKNFLDVFDEMDKVGVFEKHNFV